MPVRSGMDRRQVLNRIIFFAGVAAVIAALVAFKVKVALAGGKYLVILAVILAVVWLLSRNRK